MKYFIILFMFFIMDGIAAQNVDSLALKQIDSLIQISRTLAKQQKFYLALELIDSAEKITLEKFGNMSEPYGNVCNNRGSIMLYTGNFPEAEIYFMKAKAIWEKVFGKENTNYTGSLINLAYLLNLMGNYEKSESLYLEAKEIFEVRLKNLDHLFYTNLLNNLSILYIAMGLYEKAEPLCIQFADKMKMNFGPESPDYANALNGLAILYTYMGNYEKAEPLHFEAKKIREKTLGRENTQYAQSLYNLAALYKVMGNFKKVEPLLLEAKAIREKVLGKLHPDYATSLLALANFYKSVGKFEKAEALFLESIAIREKVLGREHPDYAIILEELATLYDEMGSYDKVELLYLEAKAIKEKVLGKEHPDYAQNLINLGAHYCTMKNYEKAEFIYVEAKERLVKVLGREHPVYRAILHNLASLYMETENFEKGELYFLELSDLNQDLISKGLHHLSEEELNQYLIKFEVSQHLLFAMTQEYGSQNLISSCLNNNLFYKGFLLNAVSQVKRLALSETASSEQFNSLRSYQRLLTTLYTLPIVERDSTKIAELESKVNDLEKELTRTVSGYGEATKQIKWQDVQNKLKTNEVAIEFVSYKSYDSDSSTKMVYAALLLSHGNSQPQFITLFEEGELVSLLQANQKRKSEYVNSLYNWVDRDTTSQLEMSPSLVKLGRQKKSLYELIWEKIEPSSLENVKTIYYAPSGILHRINMGAIAIDENQRLSDRYNLIAVNSTRQIVTGVPDSVYSARTNAIVFGGIQFEADTTGIIPQEISEFPLMATRSLAAVVEDSTLRGGTWQYLHWTQKEAEVISNTLSKGGLKSEHRSGIRATEESFKALGQSNTASPRVLHIATHGFFFPDPAQETATSPEDVSVFKWSDNPMIRSGLILAGGNYAWQNGKPVSPEKEDGILTAYEISQMNLSNTELVVLSACETGLGDIQGNEGVYGLQRAFKIAGAKYLIMSLWQVPDRETMEFMTTFYKNWLEEKLTIPDAFRKTQREMRDRFFNPYSWAGFVLVE
ncbi:MAG: CHAT domain-containing protein [Saprospiraceae bacterium]|nr:CHAT domain-containing protein [Saprospiraceae bacterium]